MGLARILNQSVTPKRIWIKVKTWLALTVINVYADVPPIRRGKEGRFVLILWFQENPFIVSHQLLECELQIVVD